VMLPIWKPLIENRTCASGSLRHESGGFPYQNGHESCFGLPRFPAIRCCERAHEARPLTRRWIRWSAKRSALWSPLRGESGGAPCEDAAVQGTDSRLRNCSQRARFGLKSLAARHDTSPTPATWDQDLLSLPVT